MPFNCDKHGYILYGATRLNCEREQEQIAPKITPQAPLFSPHHLLPRHAFLICHILNFNIREANICRASVS